MRSRNKGFTLIELMIVVAIIGILAGIAITIYRDYSIRAQVSEGIAAVTDIQKQVQDAYASNGVPPADRTAAGMSPMAGDSAGTYISQIAIANGVVEVTFGNRANEAIRGLTLGLQPMVSQDSTLSWLCGRAAPSPGRMTIPGGDAALAHTSFTAANERLLPRNCRSTG